MKPINTIGMNLMSAIGGVCRTGFGAAAGLIIRRLGRFYRRHRQDLPILGELRHGRSQQYEALFVLCLG